MNFIATCSYAEIFTLSSLSCFTCVCQESERKRKQLESQLQEFTIRLQELERGKGDVDERVVKLSVRAQNVMRVCTAKIYMYSV